MAPRVDTHERLTRDATPPQGSSDRGFGLVFATVFGLLGAYKLWHGSGLYGAVFLALGVLFLAAALVVPRVLAPLNRLWTRFGLLLHSVTSPVFLGLVFFVAIVPTGLLMRAFGKDPLRLRLDPAARSYWIERKPPGPDPQSMAQQF